MTEHIVNLESVRVQITRGELCDLLIALDAVHQMRPEVEKWPRLHDKLRVILDAHDLTAKEKDGGDMNAKNPMRA